MVRTLTPYYIVMNDNWVSQYTFSSQIDIINEKTMYLGLDQVMISHVNHATLIYTYIRVIIYIYNNMILTLASASYKHKKKIISIRNKKTKLAHVLSLSICMGLHELSRCSQSLSSYPSVFFVVDSTSTGTTYIFRTYTSLYIK
jgi:hypothetical protein